MRKSILGACQSKSTRCAFKVAVSDGHSNHTVPLLPTIFFLFTDPLLKLAFIVWSRPSGAALEKQVPPEPE